MEVNRKILFSKEFEEFFKNLDTAVREKYIYAFNIIKTQYVVNKKFIKKIEESNLYELRISISSNEYRTLLFTMNHESFIESTCILLLNSFLKKSSKQYKSEIRLAQKILTEYVEE